MNLHKPVTSVDSLKSTIEIDSQTYRWFSYLITQKEIMAQLGTLPETANLYRQLKRLSIFQRIIEGIVLILLLSVMGGGPEIILWSGLIFIWPMVKINSIKKQITAKISLTLLFIDFKAEEIGYKTLYQIAEFYNRRYKIPSLIDVICAFDQILRVAVICAVIVSIFISPMKFWQVISLITITYVVVRAVLSTNYIYRRLGS